jgi:hypothetical protein
MQAAAEDEMPFEQRAGVAEDLEYFALSHRGEGYGLEWGVESRKTGEEN